jgi:hypothetical protein
MRAKGRVCGASELGIPGTGSVRSCLWRSPDLVDQQHPAKAGPGKTAERGRVQAVTGADLGEEKQIGGPSTVRYRSS